MGDAKVRVHGILGGPAGKKINVPVTRDLLNKLGVCMVAAFVREAKKDFAKRNWSGVPRDHSAPIWDSFSYQIRGGKTVEVVSTFPDLDVLTKEGVPPRKMTWLTQEAKDRNPEQYALTPDEKERGAKKTNRLRKDPLTGHVRHLPPNYVPRSPLVVPLKTQNGIVIFRAAPFTIRDAWVHPGVARFTFAQRAARAGKESCLRILEKEIVGFVLQGDGR